MQGHTNLLVALFILGRSTHRTGFETLVATRSLSIHGALNVASALGGHWRACLVGGAGLLLLGLLLIFRHLDLNDYQLPIISAMGRRDSDCQ
jgi:hypothetical protein